MITRKMWHLPSTDLAAQKAEAERWVRMHKNDVVEVHDHQRWENCNDRCAVYGV